MKRFDLVYSRHFESSGMGVVPSGKYCLHSVHKKEVEKLQKKVNDLIFSMKYATDYLDENPLNSIGHKSKAHNQMLFALKHIKPEQILD